MTVIHGGNPSYGIAGEKVIVRTPGEDDREAYFTGVEIDVGYGGEPYLVFHTNLTDYFSVGASTFVEATYTTEEEHEEELLVLVFS